jgi:hypothetical protein
MEAFGTKAAAAGIHVVLKMRQAVPSMLPTELLHHGNRR